jgi:hypothetical protein
MRCHREENRHAGSRNHHGPTAPACLPVKGEQVLEPVSLLRVNKVFNNRCYRKFEELIEKFKSKKKSRSAAVSTFGR